MDLLSFMIITVGFGFKEHDWLKTFWLHFLFFGGEMERNISVYRINVSMEV